MRRGVGVLSSAMVFVALALPCAAQTAPSCDEVARDLPRFTSDAVTFHGIVDHIAIVSGLITIRMKCVTAAGDTVADGEFAFVRTLYRQLPTDSSSAGSTLRGILRVTGVVREPGFYTLFPAPLNGPDDRFRGPWLDVVRIVACPELPCTMLSNDDTWSQRQKR